MCPPEHESDTEATESEDSSQHGSVAGASPKAGAAQHNTPAAMQDHACLHHQQLGCALHRQENNTPVLIYILMYPPHPLRACWMSAGDLDSEGRRGSGLSQGSSGSEPPASPADGAASTAGPGDESEREFRRSATLRRMGSMQGCVTVSSPPRCTTEVPLLTQGHLSSSEAMAAAKCWKFASLNAKTFTLTPVR